MQKLWWAVGALGAVAISIVYAMGGSDDRAVRAGLAVAATSTGLPGLANIASANDASQVAATPVVAPQSLFAISAGGETSVGSEPVNTAALPMGGNPQVAVESAANAARSNGIAAVVVLNRSSRSDDAGAVPATQAKIPGMVVRPVSESAMVISAPQPGTMAVSTQVPAGVTLKIEAGSSATGYAPVPVPVSDPSITPGATKR